MFTNLKVLELASVLAGPSVGQFFAELGADVIKVENLLTHGDITRSWKSSHEQTDDRSAYFCAVNWGKRSLALDLNLDSSRDTIHKLAAIADVVIASYKPGDAEKLNTDFKTLSSINPGLIYGQISGYGAHNPRVGYDAVIQAEAGFMFMNGEPGGPSLKMPVALIDILAAHHLKEGILLAMLEKTKTGNGKFVEVSLIQAAISSLANQASNWLVAKRLPQKQGSAHPNIAPYGEIFRTADGKEILLAIGSDKQFKDLCGILSLAHLSDNRLFSTNYSRVQNREELNQLISTRVSVVSSSVLLKEIHDKKIPAGVIQNIQQVFDMPEAQPLLISSGDLQGVRTFVATNESHTRALLPPPHFGEHTESILKNLAF